MNKRKLGGIRLTPKKNTLSVFYLSDIIHEAEDRLQAEAGCPERSTFLSDE
jgi:hypothetical protein